MRIEVVPPSNSIAFAPDFRSLGSIFHHEQPSRIDVLQFVEQFSPEKRKVLLNNLIGIELSDGCSSGCNDCFLQVERVPSHKQMQISYESLDRLFATYGSEMSDIFTLYHGNEMTDWHDNGRDVSDLYKLFREYFPEKYFYFSTYFPSGSDDVIEDMTVEMIKDNRKNAKARNTIRLSLRSRNKYKRIFEYASHMKRLAKIMSNVKARLADDHIPDSYFDNIFQINSPIGLFQIADPLNRRKNLGRKFDEDEFDPFSMISSPVSLDGVVIGTKGFKAYSMDAVSMFNHNGFKTWDIKPDGDFAVPKRLTKGSLDYISNWIEEGILNGLMPPLQMYREKSGQIVLETEPAELSREIFVFREFLEDIAGIRPLYDISTIEYIFKEELHKIFVRAKAAYEIRGTQVEYLMTASKDTPYDNYFHTLAADYLKVMDFVFKYFADNFEYKGGNMEIMIYVIRRICQWNTDMVRRDEFDMQKDIEEFLAQIRKNEQGTSD